MRLLPVLLIALLSACGGPLPTEEAPDGGPADLFAEGYAGNPASCRRDFCPTAPARNVDFGRITINGLPSCACVCSLRLQMEMWFTPWPWESEALVEERRRWGVFCPSPEPLP